MTSWIPYVFVRIVLFLIGGILIGISYPDIISPDAVNTIFTTLIFFYCIAFVIQNISATRIKAAGFIGLIAVFVSGYIGTIRNNDLHDPAHVMHVTDKIECYEAIVTNLAQEREKTWKFETEVLATKQEAWRKTSGKILVYLSKSDFKEPFHYGDILIIRGNPQRVPLPGNPGEFDYRRFLEFKNIYHQHFLRKGNVKLVRNEPPYRFMQLAFALRTKADSTLKKFVHGRREQATASALVLGVTDGLDDELLNAYAATGAMHVLAVSGLHISIIYLILAFVLKPLKKIKHGQIILAMISIVVLWGYSFVTGLSPSVLRAVVMFTFMAMAKASGRRTNIYNTLAAAAFALLVYDPYMIMSVGFQLSFLAVLGIVYVQPLLQRWWEPQSWVLNEIWKVSCVSIAAQVVTFPLCLLYFHQFPNYFLLSNLFVIPGSFIVLLAGIGVLAFGFIDAAGIALGFLLEWTIRLLNYIVFAIESFPFSMMENINISAAQCWILMAITALTMLMFVKRKLEFLKAAIAFGILFSTLRWIDLHEQVHAQNMIVYKVPGHRAIDLLDHGHASFYADSALAGDHQKIRFHIRPNRQLHGIQRVDTAVTTHVMDGCQVIVWHSKTIMCVTRKQPSWPAGISPDLLIISNNAEIDLSTLPRSLLSACIILDSSNSFYFADKMMQNAEKLGLKAYSVLHHGAFKRQL